MAQQNIRERDVKMYKLIVDSYVQSTKHHLPESVFQDWFGEAGLMKLPGTGRAVRPQASGSDAGGIRTFRSGRLWSNINKPSVRAVIFRSEK